MPDAISHYLLGKSVINKLDAKTKRIIQNNLKIFYLGCQGPDIFFYYKFYSNSENKRISEFAKNIHSVHPETFLTNVFSSIKTSFSNSKDVLSAYMFGFLCHLSFDKCAHPFINYFCDYKTDKKSDNNHKRYEVLIDTAMLEQKEGKKAEKFKINNFLGNNRSDICRISKLLHSAVKNVYDKKINVEEIKKSFKFMRLGLNLIYDPTGIKKKLIYGIEKAFKINVPHSNALYPAALPKADILNLNHNNRVNSDDNKIQHLSFLDIFNKSVNTSVLLITGADLFLSDNIDSKELNKIILTGYNQNE